MTSLNSNITANTSPLNLSPSIILFYSPSLESSRNSPNSLTTKMNDDPTRMVLINPRTNSRVFLIQQIGVSTQFGLAAVGIPVFRAILVTDGGGGNSQTIDTNEMVVAVKVLPNDDSESDFLTRSAAKTESVYLSTHIALLRQTFSDKDFNCVSFEFMNIGSMYEVMVNGFAKDGMPEPLMLLVLHHLLLAMLYIFEKTQLNHGQICANHIYLNDDGVIKVGYGASVVEYSGCLTGIKDGSWPFLDPAKAWGWTPPEVAGSTHDRDELATDIWHFGVTALELIYGGMRVRNESSLLCQLDEIFKNKKIPASLVDDLGKSEIHPMKKQKPSFFGDVVGAGMGVVKKMIGQSSGGDYVAGVLSITPPHRSVLISHSFAELVIECINPNPLERPSIGMLLTRPVFHACSNITGKDLLWKR